MTQPQTMDTSDDAVDAPKQASDAPAPAQGQASDAPAPAQGQASDAPAPAQGQDEGPTINLCSSDGTVFAFPLKYTKCIPLIHSAIDTVNTPGDEVELGDTIVPVAIPTEHLKLVVEMAKFYVEPEPAVLGPYDTWKEREELQNIMDELKDPNVPEEDQPESVERIARFYDEDVAHKKLQSMLAEVMQKRATTKIKEHMLSVVKDLSPSDYIPFLCSVNFLQNDNMIDVILQLVAEHMIREKMTRDQMCEYLGIECDLTPDQEREFRDELAFLASVGIA